MCLRRHTAKAHCEWPANRAPPKAAPCIHNAHVRHHWCPKLRAARPSNQICDDVALPHNRSRRDRPNLQRADPPWHSFPWLATPSSPMAVHLIVPMALRRMMLKRAHRGTGRHAGQSGIERAAHEGHGEATWPPDPRAARSDFKRHSLRRARSAAEAKV